MSLVQTMKQTMYALSTSYITSYLASSLNAYPIIIYVFTSSTYLWGKMPFLIIKNPRKIQNINKEHSEG